MVDAHDKGGEAPCFAHLVDEPAGAETGTPDLQVWFNPDCSKCRTAQGLLAKRGIDATYVDYLHQPPTVDQLRDLLRMLGTTDARAIARTGESLWTELELDVATDDDVLRAMTAHPILIERPIAVIGSRAVVARPPERVLELLDESRGTRNSGE